jgi:TRAP-type C4-dicarboxylate transport system permease small subunit
MNVRKIIDFIVESAVILSLTGMVVSVVVQVFTRFFMESAPHWTEEAARMFFIFSVAFGAGLAIRDHAFVQLDYFLNKLNVSYKHKILVIIQGIILIFGILLSYYSIKFIGIGSSETSPSLQIKMSIVFSSMLILGILVTYYSAFVIVNNKTPQEL